MVQVEFDSREREERIILQPNSSLPWPTLRLILFVTGGVTLGVAAMFALLGIWLVLPFAGLEVLALTLGLWYVFHRLDRQQVVRLNEHQIVIEQGRHKPEQRWVCQRPWCRFRVYHGHAWYPRELWLRCHYQHIQIGEFLSDDERKHLQQHLSRFLIYD